MKSNLLIILLLLLSTINSIDISILKGEKLFNENTPIIVNILSEEKKEKSSNVELICVIDVSGSMVGEKIKLVKQSLKLLLEMMGENDKLGLVLFNHHSQKLLDLTYTTTENKKNIINLINSIEANGGTYILGGLEIAVNMLEKSSIQSKSKVIEKNKKNISSAIILLSDGMDNRMDHIEIGNGLKDLTKKLDLGFTLHTFGYGKDHDPKIMNTLATIRDGGFYYVEEYKKVAEYFVNVLGACVSTISERGILKIKSQYNIIKVYGLKDLFKYELKNNYFETEMLQIMSGKEYTYVFEIKIPDDKYDEDDFIDVEFEYMDNSNGKKYAIKKNKIEKMDKGNQEKANNEYLRVALYENMNEVTELTENNKKDEAEEKLKDIKKNLKKRKHVPQNYIRDINNYEEIFYGNKVGGVPKMQSLSREGMMKRQGQTLSFSNSIQREMVYAVREAQGDL